MGEVKKHSAQALYKEAVQVFLKNLFVGSDKKGCFFLHSLIKSFNLKSNIKYNSVLILRINKSIADLSFPCSKTSFTWQWYF